MAGSVSFPVPTNTDKRTNMADHEMVYALVNRHYPKIGYRWAYVPKIPRCEYAEIFLEFYCVTCFGYRCSRSGQNVFKPEFVPVLSPLHGRGHSWILSRDKIFFLSF